jgi:hypothetical protein
MYLVLRQKIGRLQNGVSMRGKQMTSIGNINGSESANLYFLSMQQTSKSENATAGLYGLLKGAGAEGVTGLGANGQGFDGLRTKIDDAVAGALKKLDKSSSASEIMQTIKTTVDSTLKANGIDPKNRCRLM